MESIGLQKSECQKTEVRMYGFRLPFGPIIGIRNNEVSQMLRNYIQTAMCQAKYEILPDDGSFYGEIPSFDGVYANADKLEKCREELEEVLEEWILLRVSRNLPLPVVEGMELVIKETA
jgi:predicted RNase H-like HicB family nuclease